MKFENHMNYLSNKSLSELFAESIAGWKRKEVSSFWGRIDVEWHSPKQENSGYCNFKPPDFAGNINDIMPWLNRYASWNADKVAQGFEVTVESEGRQGRAVAETLPRAACLAILKEKSE